MKFILKLTLLTFILSSSQFIICSDKDYDDIHHDNFFGQRKPVTEWKSATPKNTSQTIEIAIPSQSQSSQGTEPPVNTPREGLETQTSDRGGNCAFGNNPCEGTTLDFEFSCRQAMALAAHQRAQAAAQKSTLSNPNNSQGSK